MPSSGMSGPKSAGRSAKPVEKLFACRKAMLGEGGKGVKAGWRHRAPTSFCQPSRRRASNRLLTLSFLVKIAQNGIPARKIACRHHMSFGPRL